MKFVQTHLFLLITSMFYGVFVYSGDNFQSVLSKTSFNEKHEAINYLENSALNEEDWKNLKEQCIINRDVNIRRQCMVKIMQLPAKNPLFLEKHEKKTHILLGSKFEKQGWELSFLSKTAHDEDGVIRMLTAFQLSAMKGVESAKIIADILDYEFKLTFAKRGIANFQRQLLFKNDYVVIECVNALIVLAEDDIVMRFLIDLNCSDDVRYCIEHIKYKSRKQLVRSKLISDGIEKTTSKWLKMELIDDAKEIGDKFYLQALDQAMKDDFRYFAKENVWFYPVKEKAEEALRIINRKR